jgi:hypothetical protein
MTTVVVSERFSSRHFGVRGLRVAADFFAFDKLLSGTPTEIVFDTHLPKRLTDYDALMALGQYRSRARQRAALLVWLDGTPNSLHMFEEASVNERITLRKGLAGVVCYRPECLRLAIAAVRRGDPWVDPHETLDPVAPESVLYNELRKNNSAAAIMIALAFRSMEWRELAYVCRRSEHGLAVALGKQVRPAFERLGWIECDEDLTKEKVVSLMTERRQYVARFAREHHPHLYTLFQEAA